MKTTKGGKGGQVESSGRGVCTLVHKVIAFGTVWWFSDLKMHLAEAKGAKVSRKKIFLYDVFIRPLVAFGVAMGMHPICSKRHHCMPDRFFERVFGVRGTCSQAHHHHL